MVEYDGRMRTVAPIDFVGDELVQHVAKEVNGAYWRAVGPVSVLWPEASFGLEECAEDVA